MTESPLDRLVHLLDLEPLEEDRFRGRQPETSMQRVFGGQVAAQALVAAGRTVESSRPVHSLHAYFLRPGDPRVPIDYQVDRSRDGRSFTTRRVVALQQGKPIFNMSASFHIEEEGLTHQVEIPAVPGPDELPTLAERFEGHSSELAERMAQPGPIDMRYVTEPPLIRGKGMSQTHQQVWVRTAGALPDDPLLHVCLVTYVSDMTLLDAVLMRHGLGLGTPELSLASLDHAMWFHEPFRADQWFLYEQESPWAGQARGLGRGTIHTPGGRHVVSVVQEGLLRPNR